MMCNALKNNKFILFKFYLFFVCCCFFGVENVYAYKIEFKQAHGKWVVATCYTNDDGKLKRQCVENVTAVCGRWSPYINDRSLHGSYCVKRDENGDCTFFGDLKQWKNHLKKSGLKSKVFEDDQVYYCVAGSSNPDNESKKYNACYECKDGSGVMKWAGEGTGADKMCSAGYKKTNKTKEECNTNYSCYVCNDNNNIMKWSDSEDADRKCSAGYYKTDIAEKDCVSKSACYVCRNDKNVMKWDTNGEVDEACETGYEIKDLSEENCEPPSVISLECSDVNDWNKNISADNVSCAENKMNAEYNSCMKTGEVGSNSSSNDEKYYIYVRSQKDDSTCSGDLTSGKVQLSDGHYYVAVKVSTEVLINQTGNFAFGGINENVIKAGKGFTLGQTTYNNSITWINANLDSNGNPYYRYDYKEYTYTDNACNQVDTSFKLDGKEYFYYNENGVLVNTYDLNVASFTVISRAMNNYIKTKDEGVGDINFVSCDSNNASKCNVTNPQFSVEGVWKESSREVNGFSGNEFSISNDVSKNNGVIFGNKIDSLYSYSLANSAIGVNGDDYAKAMYAAEANAAVLVNLAADTGKKFYVDLRWIYNNPWPFNLKKDSNPSMVYGMDWTLNGTCSVDVDDGYYTYDGNNVPDDPTPGIPIALSYKYRSISLGNPFPKSDTLGIPINWNYWYNNNINNKNRITYTYDNGVRYMIRLSKTGTNDAVKISDINTGTGYTNFVGFDISGTSSFVVDKFNIKEISGQSYCGLGYFYSDCDRY